VSDYMKKIVVNPERPTDCIKIGDAMSSWFVSERWYQKQLQVS